MAQPNVAREPSMDEILASIRKIIENNEAQPDLAPDAHDGGFDITTESHSGLLDHSVVEAFHVEERHSAVAQPVPRSEPVQAGQPALSLADVAARVRAASERHVAAHREPVEERETAIVAPVAREASPLVTSRMAAVAGSAANVDEPVARIEPLAVKADVPATNIASSEDAAAPVVDTDNDFSSAVGRDIAAIVSPAVGERVAQSFGALAQAIDSGPRRSFDEIAEDMLRPMLQEWLDDNLPTLVERLVREEIERVARGPRR